MPDNPKQQRADQRALDRAWVALRDFGGDDIYSPGDWIEGYIWRRDAPNDITRALMRAVVNAYNEN